MAAVLEEVGRERRRRRERARSGGSSRHIASEIDKLTAEVIQAPLKIIRKGEKCEQDIEAIEEEPPLLPLAKKAKHDSQGLPELEAENCNPKNWKDQANTISLLQLLVELLISVLREVPPQSNSNLITEHLFNSKGFDQEEFSSLEYKSLRKCEEAISLSRTSLQQCKSPLDETQ